MIPRSLESKIVRALKAMPVVAILGPRQAGKTTLALEIANDKLDKEVAWLDLERDSDLAKLAEPEDYLKRFDKKTLIIDEVQRKPDLFRALRSLVDIRKRAGEKAGHFLLLGSASRDLIQHSTETLAGRIRYLELSPFSIPEIYRSDPQGFDVNKLWLRGGFPDSYLAGDDNESWDWRSDFIASYVERDIPLMGPRVPAARMRRFWNMLAHWHGQQMNMSSLGKSMEVDHKTIRSYLGHTHGFLHGQAISTLVGEHQKAVG